MSRLPKAFSNLSIASTSQEGQEVVERSTLCVTLLSGGWRSSTDRDLSTVNRELAIQLAKLPGVQVSVFLPHCSEDDKRIAASHKVQLIEAEEMTGIDPVDWLINIPEDHSMDCIIGHGVHLGRQIPAIQRSHPCKWIQIVHNAPEALAMFKSNADAIPRGEKMQQTEIELCELADQVVAVGPKLADTYRRFLRSSKKHQDVIDLTPSIFTEFLDVEQATEETKTFCVLVTGSGGSEDFNLKGYDLAAQAIAELKGNSYQLKFVCAPRGRGDEIAEKLLKHGVDRSQLIVRSFNESRETLARLFCEVDLAIMPSRSEGFGLTALEALSAGLPVLVSSNSGLGEALMKVPNGSNCVVDSEDPKHWASKIKAVREKDRDVRLKESKDLRRNYLEKYSWEKPCGVLVEKMQNLVTGSSSHSRPLSFLQHSQSPFPPGAQTPAQTYQTSHPQSSSGQGIPPSSLEHNQPPFLAGTQNPAQTYQKGYLQRGCSQLPFHAATQTLGEATYRKSHHPQSSFHRLPSSVEYCQWPTVAAQTYEGPEYQSIYSQSFSVQGRPPLSVEHNPLPFPACSQTSQTQSHDPHEVKRTLPSSFQSSPQDSKRAKLSTSNKADATAVETFDVKTCRRKLAEHYEKTAKVPTTVWSSKFQVDLEQIYTRLSWMKQEQTTAGSSRKELSQYTEIFTEKKKSGVAKRILVQGETGIGKTTFVKKLLVDWSNLEEAEMDEEKKDALRKFDLVVSINLKEVPECRTFKEVLGQSRVFPDDETSSIDDLISYIGENQDKVLLVFDGYDEYRAGSEAEEKYGSRSNSPIYKIFHGNIMRDCTVLVTTRSSRADELQESADTNVEITGFDWCDQEDFMIKFLGSQTEVDGLLKLLRNSMLDDLARVPLLNLFFCLLWKEEKEKLKDGFKSKTELFQAIVKHILQHSHKRHSPSNATQLKEADYHEILTEIGKVALEGLLRGDLLFKFGELSETVRGEKSVIVGLLQVSESGPSVEPKEMVSFIHKSIQEYLAAWFVTYRCVPEGNLGGIEQHACTVEDSKALENVFQFVSGLSNQGAEKVFEHFSSVRTLDLAMTIADVDNQTDSPIYDLTVRHWRFSDLAFNCFREVNTRTELLSRFLDCFGEIVPVPNYVLRSQFMPNVKDLSTLAHPRTFAFRFADYAESIPRKSLEQFIKCFHVPKTSQNAEDHRVIDFLVKFMTTSEHEAILENHPGVRRFHGCSLHAILRFSIDQFRVYVTDLFLNCDNHARLFTETTEVSFLVRCLECWSDLSDETMKCLGGAIRDCKQLRFITITNGGDSMCDLLEQVPNPSKCSLKLGSSFGLESIMGEFGCYSVCLTSAGAVKLASLLPRFNNISHLNLSFVDAEVDALITTITDKSLKELRLSRINLTPVAAAALGRSLPKMSSLEIFELIGIDGNILQAGVMELLFGEFNKTMPLQRLSFGGFSGKGCLTPLINSLHFFSKLRVLRLVEVIMDDQDFSGLLESWRLFRNLETLCMESKGLAPLDPRVAEVSMVYSVPRRNCKRLILKGICLTPTIAAMLGQSLPKMWDLEVLYLTGQDGNVVPAEQMERLFEGFTKPLPLCTLTFSGFSVRGCLAPLTRSLSSFPNLRDLSLRNLNMDEHDLRGLLESFRFVPNMKSLDLSGNSLGPAVTSIVPHVINFKNLSRLYLHGTGSMEDLNSVRQGLREHRNMRYTLVLYNETTSESS